MSGNFVVKGIICHTPSRDALEIRQNAYAVCRDGICEGVYDELPDQYRDYKLIDCTDMLVMPGMIDLHIHASQYTYIGTGMDDELLGWLEKKTFPEEIRYIDEEYAGKAYDIFAAKMQKSATTRAVIFATIHAGATLALMDRMEKTGLLSYVGKVNMDRNAAAELAEKNAKEAAESTRRFLEDVIQRNYQRTKPVITPRFVPTCSDELMEELSKIRKEYDLPVQSHLSENPEEVEWVRQLSPDAEFYGDVYDRFGLFGKDAPTVMAHCVYSTEAEAERILQNGVWIAHCPGSNMNLSSGIAPIRKYLEMGIRVGLGSDVAGGNSESIFRAATAAIQVSKLFRRYADPDARPLSFAESFYMATKGGGSFFGKVGSFEKGYEFDAVVLNDRQELLPPSDSAADRLERAFYLGLDQKCIVRKFAAGREIAL